MFLPTFGFVYRCSLKWLSGSSWYLLVKLMEFCANRNELSLLFGTSLAACHLWRLQRIYWINSAYDNLANRNFCCFHCFLPQNPIYVQVSLWLLRAMECLFLWMCLLCLPNSIISTTLSLLHLLTSQYSHRQWRGLLQDSATVAAPGNPTAPGLSVPPTFTTRPCSPPTSSSLICFSFPLKAAHFEGQKRAARRGCLQHWFGAK